MEIKELYLIVKKFYGYKIKMLYMNSGEKTVGGLLYDSFFLECRIDDLNNKFTVGICLGRPERVIRNFWGKDTLCDCNEELIVNKLVIIDHYCRLRLPDKFLEKYELAYAGDNIDVMKRLGRSEFYEE